jgi:protein ImuB
LAVRVAIADTLSAAWAVAHFAELELAAENSSAGDEAAILAALRVPLVVAEGQAWAALAGLPIEALRLPAQACELLAELGLRRIDELAALERATLLARFGPEVLLGLDRARGAASEAIAACRPPAAWEFEWPLQYATARQEMIELALAELVARACGTLARERLGVLRLACRFDYEQSSSERVPAAGFVVGLYRPSASARHVGDLVRLRLARLRLRGPVAGLRVTVLAADRLEFHQQEMFADDLHEPGRAAPRELAALVDRLGNRLGARAVLRPWLLAEAQPEYACQYQPLASLARSGTGVSPRGGKKKHWQDASGTRRKKAHAKTAQRGGQPHFSARTAQNWDSPRSFGDRPIHLEPRPLPLAVLAVAPEGPPMKFRLSGQDERVVRVWGPERIETGWWRARLVRRDYYQVETARGARYWLFRELAGGGWFLHGEFA